MPVYLSRVGQILTDLRVVVLQKIQRFSYSNDMFIDLLFLEIFFLVGWNIPSISNFFPLQPTFLAVISPVR